MQMEPTHLYFAVSEGVHSSWRAIGVLENLHTDGDIAQLLVTLYSQQKQKEGEECMARCGHCHRPLTLYCNTCRRPSHLALPTHPPPSSVSSSPPALPPQTFERSTPQSVTADIHYSPRSVTADVHHTSHLSATADVHHTSHLSATADVHHTSHLSATADVHHTSHLSATADVHHTSHLHSQKPQCDVKDEEESASPLQIEGEFDFDDCPVDFGGVGQDSMTHDGQSTTAKAAFSENFTPSSSVKEDENGDPKKPAVTLNCEKRKKRRSTAVGIHAGRSKRGRTAKKNEHIANSCATDSCVKGNQTREDSHGQSEDSIHGTTPKHTRLSSKGVNDIFQENVNEEQNKGKVSESRNIEDGFIIPEEERHSAQIHTFDDSFFKRYKMEDGPSRSTKLKSSVTNIKLAGTVREEQANPDPEASEMDSPGEVGVSVSSNRSHSESLDFDKAGKHSLRILASAQKIPPLKTPDGNYMRSLYTHFECLYCKKAFVQKRTFNKHIQTHIEENLHKCSLCSRRFESLYSLREHEKKHKHECDICGKKCTEKNDYNDHMKLHTENNGVMKCPGCTYRSTDFYAYRKHKYECAYLRPALQCEICGVHLKSVKSLKHHIAAIHKNERPYKCTLCEKSFVFKTKLTCHIKYNHAEGGRLFHCDKCGNRFIDPKGLKSHLKSVHSNEKPFKCTYCPSAFARRYTLGVHMRLHTGEKPFRCSECLQAFVQKPSLLLHLKSHHGQDSTVKKITEPGNCS